MIKNYLKSTKGITLVELLVTIVLLLMVSTLVMSILMNGMNTAQRVTTETMIRDEADYIMASLLTELYVLKTSEIKESRLTNSSHPSRSYLIVKKEGSSTDHIIGFDDGNLRLPQGLLKPAREDISISRTSRIEFVQPGQYRIHLVLTSSSTSNDLELLSEIQIIHNLEGES